MCDPGRPAAPVRSVSTVVACLISTQGIWWHGAHGIGGKRRVWGAIRICWHVRNTQRKLKRGGGRGGEVGVCWCGSGGLRVRPDTTPPLYSSLEKIREKRFDIKKKNQTTLKLSPAFLSSGATPEPLALRFHINSRVKADQLALCR